MEIPDGEEFRDALVGRGWEPPEEVVIPYALAFSPLLQPEDCGVLVRLLMRDPRSLTSMGVIASEMQASGWKMGETRFAAIWKRLKRAGHVKQVSVYNPSSGRPQWVIRVYRNPANNDQYVDLGVEASPQVMDESVETTMPKVESSFGTVETTVPAGQKDSEVSTVSEATPWKHGIRKSTVPQGQTRNRGDQGFGVHPPHPPEEGGTTSSAGKQATASPDDLARAAAFLMRLPGPWACGKQQAAKLAPLLLAQGAEMGWDLDVTLRIWLTRAESGKKPVENHHAALRWRINNLVYRDAALNTDSPAGDTPEAGPLSSAPVAPAATTAGVPPWCGKCGDPGSHPLVNVARINPRMRTHNGEVDGTPCPTCHPSAAAAGQH